MRMMFSPELVNPPFGDPGLIVDFNVERRALLFDLMLRLCLGLRAWCGSSRLSRNHRGGHRNDFDRAQHVLPGVARPSCDAERSVQADPAVTHLREDRFF